MPVAGSKPSSAGSPPIGNEAINVPVSAFTTTIMLPQAAKNRPCAMSIASADSASQGALVFEIHKHATLAVQHGFPMLAADLRQRSSITTRTGCLYHAAKRVSNEGRNKLRELTATADQLLFGADRSGAPSLVGRSLESKETPTVFQPSRWYIVALPDVLKK
jgi:hypothetical protein